MALRVLIAEDEMVLALAMRSQLESLGYAVAEIAGNGREAVDLVGSERPDVVLMDIRMPEMDGLSATRALMEGSPRPIIIVTGNAGYEAAADEAGAMSLVTKPLITGDIPVIIRDAQWRFVRFMLVREECESGLQALAAWHTVRGAVRALGAREHCGEQEAFTRLHELAATQGMTLLTAAQGVAAD